VYGLFYVVALMASTLQPFLKTLMIEKHSIHGRDVWLKVDPHPVQRANPNIIPTEYFTATYYLEDPLTGDEDGEQIKDEAGETKLFESPVAALAYVQKKVEKVV
jgi:hypothetical protein